ncbi:ATP-dependent DNA helicase [Ceratobasidium sp. AG-Ba]|nr:ATP-dependent DNA helicase [Ceratobasidium sp. AG-Ba]
MYDVDELGSDDLDAVLEFSRQQYQNGDRQVQNYARHEEDVFDAVGSSHTKGHTPAYLRKNEIQGKLSALDAELNSIEAEIQSLQEARRNVLLEREALQKELAATRLPQQTSVAPLDRRSTKNYDANAQSINYADPKGFEWTHELKSRLRKVFKIQDFRLCQEEWSTPSWTGVMSFV